MESGAADASLAWKNHRLFSGFWGSKDLVLNTGCNTY